MGSRRWRPASYERQVWWPQLSTPRSRSSPFYQPRIPELETLELRWCTRCWWRWKGWKQWTFFQWPHLACSTFKKEMKYRKGATSRTAFGVPVHSSGFRWREVELLNEEHPEAEKTEGQSLSHTRPWEDGLSKDKLRRACTVLCLICMSVPRTMQKHQFHC